MKNKCTVVIVSHSVLFIMKSVLGNICTETQNTHFVINNIFYSIVTFMRLCGKILYSRPEHRWKYSAYTLHAICQSVRKPSQNMYYCFSTATMVAGTRLNVRLYVHCLSCYHLGLRVVAFYTDNQARRRHDACICLQFLIYFHIALYWKCELNICTDRFVGKRL
jgi:hypothetical protein